MMKSLINHVPAVHRLLMRDRNGLANGVITQNGIRMLLKPGRKDDLDKYLDKIKSEYDAILPAGVTLNDIHGLKRLDSRAPRLAMMRRDKEVEE